MKFVTVSLLLATSLFAKVSIIFNSCYGSPKHIVIDGEVMNVPTNSDYKQSDGKFKNFTRKFSDIFLHKAQEHKKIIISLNKFNYQTKTDDEGYFEFEAKTKKPFFSYKTDIKVYMPSKNLTNRLHPNYY